MCEDMLHFPGRGMRPLLMSEPCFNTRALRERATEIAFEALQVQEFYMVKEAVLPLYAVGKTCGVSVSVGHDTAYPVPVHEGYAMEFAIPDRRYNIAGRHLTEQLARQLAERKFKVESPAMQHAMRDIKETLCFTSLDPDDDDLAVNENPDSLKREYLLPDGTELALTAERFRSTEIIFRPETQGYFGDKDTRSLGIAHRVVAAVRGCAEAIQVR